MMFVIIVISFVEQSHARTPFLGSLVNKCADRLFERALKALPSHHVSLNGAILALPCRFTTDSSRAFSDCEHRQAESTSSLVVRSTRARSRRVTSFAARCLNGGRPLIGNVRSLGRRHAALAALIVMFGVAAAEPTQAPVQGKSIRKVVFLVRHAESLQNVANRQFAGGDPTALFQLMRLGSDAPLSDTGRSQLAKAVAKLQSDDFVAVNSVQLVAYSPLQRARETAHTLFGDNPDVPLIELPFMYERTPLEYATGSLMEIRINMLFRWLASREEACIVLVGHGQFFKRLTRSDTQLRNAEIQKCIFDGEGLTVDETACHI